MLKRAQDKLNQLPVSTGQDQPAENAGGSLSAPELQRLAELVFEKLRQALELENERSGRS